MGETDALGSSLWKEIARRLIELKEYAKLSCVVSKTPRLLARVKGIHEDVLRGLRCGAVLGAVRVCAEDRKSGQAELFSELRALFEAAATLAGQMIDYSVLMTQIAKHSIKKVDSNYFGE